MIHLALIRVNSSTEGEHSTLHKTVNFMKRKKLYNQGSVRTFLNVLTELVLFCSDRTFFSNIKEHWNILKIIERMNMVKLCSDWAKT